MDAHATRAAEATAAASADERSLRLMAADLLVERADVVIADTIAVFPLSGPRRLEADFCTRLGRALTALVAETIRAGRCEPQAPSMADVIALVDERALTPDQFFTFAYTTLTTSVDELSLDSRLGATSDGWPMVAAGVRRAFFEALAAWTTRKIDAPTEAAVTDTLTTLHTRPVLDIVLRKESHRAERFSHWLSLILFDVNDFSAVNQQHGYGVGDRVLERLGILLRSYFREHDWVARYADDAIAVCLPETAPEDALALADRARVMVSERLTFRDYRTEQRVAITVSTALVSAQAAQGQPIDIAQVLAEAEAATARAKSSGHARVEHVQLMTPARPRTDP